MVAPPPPPPPRPRGHVTPTLSVWGKPPCRPSSHALTAAGHLPPLPDAIPGGVAGGRDWGLDAADGGGWRVRPAHPVVTTAARR